ncbi:MAG: hypothetical protein DRJ01_07655 [Bacteroidetes bacterium]|nr:MAG: hypothetical protein DRJ01_07655 [Bacteroidota bacterium]
MKKLFILSLITVIVFTISCESKKARTALLPSVSGKAGEVVLVMKEKYKGSEIGKDFKKLFSQEVYGLPQSEPMFNLFFFRHDAFTNILKLHRNIIFTQISPSIKKAKISFRKNVWARPQLFISIVAPNEKEFKKLFNENKDKLLRSVELAERQRIINNYKKYEEKSLCKLIRDKQHISISVPKGYALRIDTSNFMWVSHETPQISQGILIYSYNINDSIALNEKLLIHIRDSVLKKNVPGPLPNTYMITEHALPVEFKEFYLNRKYTAQLRGLWKVQNDYMGGPFISFSRFDMKRNRIVTVDAYVYAPKFDKRNYLRQVEGILYTMDIVK